MTALLHGMGLFLKAADVGDYDPAAELDPAQVPITLAGVPESPDRVLTLTTYPGGPEPDIANGWEYPRLQVRSRALDPLDALDLDRLAYDALQGAGPVALPDGVWFLQDCYALQSEAEPLGQDSNGRWEFARNYQLSVELV